MKASYAEFERQTSEPAAPFPTQPPLTEEIIIPSVNQVHPLSSYGETAYHRDDAYPLVHKMIYDLMQAQDNVSGYQGLKVAKNIEDHIVSHVAHEIRGGYIAETPLELNPIPSQDEFTLHVARQYVEYELLKMRQVGPDQSINVYTASPPETLFDEDTDLRELSNPEATVLYPSHIEAVSEDQMSKPEIMTLKKFDKIVRKMGGKVVSTLQVSLRSKELPIVGPHGTKVIEVIEKSAS